MVEIGLNDLTKIWGPPSGPPGSDSPDYKIGKVGPRKMQCALAIELWDNNERVLGQLFLIGLLKKEMVNLGAGNSYFFLEN